MEIVVSVDIAMSSYTTVIAPDLKCMGTSMLLQKKISGTTSVTGEPMIYLKYVYLHGLSLSSSLNGLIWRHYGYDIILSLGCFRFFNRNVNSVVSIL